jgi:hypothetical protein
LITGIVDFLHFVALFVEILLVAYCVKVLRRMKSMGIRRTFMKPVLFFGLIIVGARVSEMLGYFAENPYFIALECMVLIVAFSILVYGVYDYDKMLQRK